MNFASGGKEQLQEPLGDDYAKVEDQAETEAPVVTEIPTEENVIAGMEPGTREAVKDKSQTKDEAEVIYPIPTLSPTTYEDDVLIIEEVASAALEPEVT